MTGVEKRQALKKAVADVQKRAVACEEADVGKRKLKPAACRTKFATRN
jgi:hypothetical protein